MQNDEIHDKQHPDVPECGPLRVCITSFFNFIQHKIAYKYQAFQR